MITITEEELEIIKEALGIAGASEYFDSRFDDLYDALVERAEQA
jgi:hypothetical protein